MIARTGNERVNSLGQQANPAKFGTCVAMLLLDMSIYVHVDASSAIADKGAPSIPLDLRYVKGAKRAEHEDQAEIAKQPL